MLPRVIHTVFQRTAATQRYLPSFLKENAATRSNGNVGYVSVDPRRSVVARILAGSGEMWDNFDPSGGKLG